MNNIVDPDVSRYPWDMGRFNGKVQQSPAKWADDSPIAWPYSRFFFSLTLGKSTSMSPFLLCSSHAPERGDTHIYTRTQHPFILFLARIVSSFDCTNGVATQNGLLSFSSKKKRTTYEAVNEVGWKVRSFISWVVAFVLVL